MYARICTAARHVFDIYGVITWKAVNPKGKAYVSKVKGEIK